MNWVTDGAMHNGVKMSFLADMMWHVKFMSSLLMTWCALIGQDYKVSKLTW